MSTTETLTDEAALLYEYQVAMGLLWDTTAELSRRRELRDRGELTDDAFVKYQRKVYSPAHARYREVAEAFIGMLVQRRIDTLPLREWETHNSDRALFDKAFTYVTALRDRLHWDDAETEQSPTQCDLLAREVAELMGCRTRTVNKYATELDLPTPGRGQRNFRYPVEHARRILEHARDTTSDSTIRRQVDSALVKLR